MIDQYFDSLDKLLLDFKAIMRDYSIFKKVYNEKQGYIKGEICFKDLSKFHFIEVKDTEIDLKLKYRYHYMTKNDELVFRYDNAHHHVKLKSFPHHKHTSDNIIDSNEPEISQVLLEILKTIHNK